MSLEIDAVKRIAERHGWYVLAHHPQSYVLIFANSSEEERVNVYYTTGTVATTLRHRKGKKQLFRRNRTLSDLGQIFKNPRVHTGVGYYRKLGPWFKEPVF